MPIYFLGVGGGGGGSTSVCLPKGAGQTPQSAIAGLNAELAMHSIHLASLPYIF